MRLFVACVVLAALMVAVAATAATREQRLQGAPLGATGALQVLHHLGLDRGSAAPSVTLGQKIRQEDSPIYYIKLPPLPYYYISNNIHRHSQTTSFPFKKVDVDFNSNGKPTQIYHWNQPTTNIWSSSTTRYPAPASTTTPLPPTTTTTAAPSTTAKPSKKPWVTFNKYFPYNGRPSNIYVWKPRPPINMNKYKQHYFKHFNY